MPPEIPVLSALRTEFENLANDLGEELGGTLGPLDFLKDEVKPEELELRLGKASIVMRNAKEFLDNCDAFLQPLAGMNSTIAAPVYGAVKFIVTIAAAKSEVLEEVIAGLNEVFDGLPLITQSVKGSNGLLNPSDPQHRVILSALRAFVKFMEDVKGYVGGKHESLKEKDPYSDIRQKASSKAIVMSFLRQIVSMYRHSIANLVLIEDLVEYVLATQADKFGEADLQKWVVKLLGSFDVVRIIIDAVDQCEDRAFHQDGLISWILSDITARVLLVGCEEPHADLEAYSRCVVRSYLGDPVDETLVQDLIKRADNMFLYIFFLEDITNRKDMRFFRPDKRIDFGDSPIATHWTVSW
ncbi:hypothetical protein B0H10DRAFT_2224253 [Mycena sp. CBHHK59/15]|nr:hypothetical protein B0H10DRAFT_2224253 [Mycena sp. CBHHK59/15]